MEDMEIKVEKNLFAAVDIPEDIIPEILVRLPVKSLARFKCVSKTWLFLVSSYKFAKEQVRISTNNNAYLHDRLIFGSRKLPMDFYTCSLQSLVQGSEYSAGTQIYPPTDDSNLLNNFDRARVNNNPFAGQGGVISIVGSCNGLVCLDFHPMDTFVLWNPTTGKLKKLPESGTNSEGFQYAFGYDEVHDDYKVVETCHAMENGRFVSGGLGMKVYSLRTNSWKALSNWPAGGTGHTYGGMGKFLNGAIHWIVREFSDDVYWAMVSLHLATDTFIVSHLPNIGGDHAFRPVSVGILGGQLALFLEYLPSHMDIWVMKEYGVHNSWTKSVSIPFLLLDSSLLETDFFRPLPLFFWVEHGKMLIDYSTSLGIHDLNNPQPHPFGKEILVGCTTYIESLVSPHLDDELVLGQTMPSEVITEILSRLPLMSLLRFKSVSKEWRSLISSSRFVEAHLKLSTTKNDVALIFGPTTNNNQELYTCSIDSIFASTGTVYSVADENPSFVCFSLEFSVDDDSTSTPEAAAAAAEIRLLGSCNGLVCLSLSRKIILTNPATDQERILPNSSTNDDYFERSSYSFGYDQVHGDYKVVELTSTISFVEQTLVQVYSMRTNSWEAMLNWPGGDAELRSAKYLNGSLHWSVRDNQCRCIVSFDLATLTFSHSPLPNILVDTDDDDDDDDIVEVAIVGGCLAVCCTHRADMDVWVMKENIGGSGSWTRVVRVDLGNHGGFVRPRPLFFSGDGKILMNYGSSLKIYDSANPQHHIFDTDLRFDAMAYVETLVPVTLEGGEDEQHNYATGCC